MVKIKGRKKRRNTLLKLYSIWFSYFCHLLLHHSLSLCHALLLTCMLIRCAVFSFTFMLGYPLSLSASLKILLLFSSCTCSGSHNPSHSQCFHTLSPFKPFVSYFFVLHFFLALCHRRSIFSILLLNSWGYICSNAERQ